MSQEVNRKLTCILSTDVVGYSRLMEENEASTVRYLEENKKLISRLIDDYNGRVIDSPGDNLLAEFSSEVKAVDCAVKIQKVLKIKNAELIESRRMQFRIGINLGDVIEEDGRIYGSGVNIAARLEGLADPGGICISRNVYDQVKTKLDLGYEYLGEHDVKNISEPVRVYRVQSGTQTTEKVTHTGIYRWVAVATILIIIVVGLLVWRFYPSNRINTEPASIEAERPAAHEEREVPKAIAVLPFENRSPDPDQEYFILGLSEEILNAIDQIPGLNVKARTSSFSFKGQNKSIQEIAGILGVDHILEGSVSKDGKELRIITSLIRVADSSTLWTETYDKNFKHIFEIRKDIATKVADKLKLTLEALSVIGGTENIEAYELYLAAKGLVTDWKHLNALEKLNEAIALDQKFALALTLKVNALIELSAWNPDYVSNGLLKAQEAAQKAIDLEPMLGKAFLSLGSVHAAMGKFIEAEKDYKKGLDLEFETKDFMEYGLTTHYGVVGRLTNAYELIEKVLKDDPLNPNAWGSYILAIGSLGDIEGAEKEYKLKKEIFGNWFAGDAIINGLRIGAINEITADYMSQFRLGDAWPIIKENLESPEEGIVGLRELYNSGNNLSSAELTNIMLGAAYFDDYDFAMEALEKAAHINVLRNWKVWLPVMQSVRKTPRFKEWTREIGLVDYWKTYGWPDLCHPVGADDFECD